MANPIDVTGTLDGATMTEFSSDPVPDISNSPSLQPTAHRFVGIDIPEEYHTDTHPISFKLSTKEISLYETNPPKLVGQMYLPGKGEELWEVIEVSFSKAGWSTVVVQVEGSGAKHKMALEDFFGMLKRGVLQGVAF